MGGIRNITQYIEFVANGHLNPITVILNTHYGTIVRFLRTKILFSSALPETHYSFTVQQKASAKFFLDKLQAVSRVYVPNQYFFSKHLTEPLRIRMHMCYNLPTRRRLAT
jgi:hypothetical protein